MPERLRDAFGRYISSRQPTTASGVSLAVEPPARREAPPVPDRVIRYCPGAEITWRQAYEQSTVERELIERYLTPFQRAEAHRTGWVPVLSSEGREYYVCVQEVVVGHNKTPSRWGEWSYFCFHVYGVTRIDGVIARVLLLQADDPYFRAVGVQSTLPNRGPY